MTQIKKKSPSIIVLRESCEANWVQVFSSEKINVVFGNINCGVQVLARFFTLVSFREMFHLLYCLIQKTHCLLL